MGARILRIVGGQAGLRSVCLVVSLSLLGALPGDALGKGPKDKRKGKRDRQEETVKIKRLVTLEAQLASPRVEVAHKAAVELGALGVTSAADLLLNALAIGVDPKVAEACLSSLAKLPASEAIDGVVGSYLHHRSAPVRAAAIGVLVTSKGRAADAWVVAGLSDLDVIVRTTAAKTAAARKIAEAVPPMLALLTRGDDTVIPALASLATPDTARAVSELIGVAPDSLVAQCLGLILVSRTFGPDPARVQVVAALAAIPGNDTLEALTNYIAAVPENPPRASRQKAEELIESRLSGDNQ